MSSRATTAAAGATIVDILTTGSVHERMLRHPYYIHRFCGFVADLQSAETIQFLKLNPDLINDRVGDGPTTLWLAVRWGDMSVIEFLLNDKMVNIHAPAYATERMLETAIRRRAPTDVIMKLGRMGFPFVADRQVAELTDGQSLVLAALRWRASLSIVKWLCLRVELGSLSNVGRNVLFGTACAHCDMDTVLWVYTTLSYDSHEPLDGPAAIEHALTHNRSEAALWLLHSGVCPVEAVLPTAQMTLLGLAIVARAVDVVRHLLLHADPTSFGDRPRTGPDDRARASSYVELAQNSPNALAMVVDSCVLGIDVTHNRTSVIHVVHAMITSGHLEGAIQLIRASGLSVHSPISVVPYTPMPPDSDLVLAIVLAVASAAKPCVSDESLDYVLDHARPRIDHEYVGRGTLLCMAIEACCGSLVHALLQRGAGNNGPPGHRTHLMARAMRCAVRGVSPVRENAAIAIVKALLDAGYSMYDVFPPTHPMLEAILCNSKIVCLLLERGWSAQGLSARLLSHVIVASIRMSTEHRLPGNEFASLFERIIATTDANRADMALVVQSFAQTIRVTIRAVRYVAALCDSADAPFVTPVHCRRVLMPNGAIRVTANIDVCAFCILMHRAATISGSSAQQTFVRLCSRHLTYETLSHHYEITPELMQSEMMQLISSNASYNSLRLTPVGFCRDDVQWYPEDIRAIFRTILCIARVPCRRRRQLDQPARRAIQSVAGHVLSRMLTVLAWVPPADLLGL